ncbi:unnamed protein product [Parnassius apollo]|uniref:17S U2 SnRNP complex component HTATSF1 n=1 Tax=Parnassius apollo TaxID=110799 RepID=A0A8S3VY87_PARAO|nr:unnamed protein product [Parnassius apollo]
MSKLEKSSKSGFVIKLSCETVQKLTVEDDKQKIKEEAFKPDLEKVDKQKNQRTSSTDVTDENKQESILEVKTNNAKEEREFSSQKKVLKNSAEEESSTHIDKENKTETSNSWGNYAPYVTYEGDNAVYTDPNTHQKYVWNHETSAWDPKDNSEIPGRVYSYENDTHVYTEQDGSKFFWDEDKKAWIPKVDDDFLAYYQMSYGFVDNSKDEKKEEAKKEEIQKKSENAGVKRKSEPQWFEPSDDKNTKVYVSNLPLDLTEEEFVNFMQKCGLVERDPSSQKMKVKLYMDKEQNCFKGDALCTYIKIESVDLALKLLDGSDFKGNKVKVERAQFQLKGEYNPALKPKKKKKKELEKIKKMQQKLFDWRPEKFIGERSKHERVVIVKNLFHPTDFDKEVQLILDYQQDLREECGKCGDVRKVVIYDRHPEGVAQITMKEPEQADAVVQLINGRWFGKRQITAEIWDGRTKYRIAETDSEITKRIDNWEDFLEGKDGDKAKEKDSDIGKPSEEKIEDKHDGKTTLTKTVEADSDVDTKT